MPVLQAPDPTRAPQDPAGLKVSLAGAQEKLEEMEGLTTDDGPVALGLPTIRRNPEQPSLVVLHGGPDVGHSYLLPGVRPLAVDHHVVLFDFRGCGQSSRDLSPEALQPEYIIEDTHRLIRRMNLGQVDLLGFSTGGRAATR